LSLPSRFQPCRHDAPARIIAQLKRELPLPVVRGAGQIVFEAEGQRAPPHATPQPGAIIPFLRHADQQVEHWADIVDSREFGCDT
jgi:hypothetical protein